MWPFSVSVLFESWCTPFVLKWVHVVFKGRVVPFFFFFFCQTLHFFFFSQLMGKRFKYWWIHFYFSVVIQHKAKTTYPKSWIQCRIFRIQQTFMSSIDIVQLYFWHTIWCFSFLQGVKVSKFCMLVWHEKEKPILTFFLRDKVIKDEIEDDN